MPQSVERTVDMLVDVGVDTLVGALVLAVVIATLTAGVYLWLRRGKSDVTAILVTLILVANLTCLMTGARFIESRNHVDELRASLRHAAGYGRGYENRESNMPRPFGRSARGWRRHASPGQAAANRIVNTETVAASPTK